LEATQPESTKLPNKTEQALLINLDLIGKLDESIFTNIVKTEKVGGAGGNLTDSIKM